MNTANLYQKLFKAGFTRVERDDRLLDIMPAEHFEKGIELWEKWDAQTIFMVRIHLPVRPKYVQLYQLDRKEIETALHENKLCKLSEYEPIAKSVVEILDFDF